jgi:hypothetical protein
MSQSFFPSVSSRPGSKRVHARIDTTTGGTLASTAGGKGVTITKVAAKTGRYRFTFSKRWRGLLNVVVAIGGLTDAATTAAKATGFKLRNVNIPASGNYVEVQFTNALADAELEDGISAWVTFELTDSSV